MPVLLHETDLKCIKACRFIRILLTCPYSLSSSCLALINAIDVPWFVLTFFQRNYWQLIVFWGCRWMVTTTEKGIIWSNRIEGERQVKTYWRSFSSYQKLKWSAFMETTFGLSSCRRDLFWDLTPFYTWPLWDSNTVHTSGKLCSNGTQANWKDGLQRANRGPKTDLHWKLPATGESCKTTVFVLDDISHRNASWN